MGEHGERPFLFQHICPHRFPVLTGSWIWQTPRPQQPHIHVLCAHTCRVWTGGYHCQSAPLISNRLPTRPAILLFQRNRVYPNSRPSTLCPCYLQELPPRNGKPSPCLHPCVTSASYNCRGLPSSYLRPTSPHPCPQGLTSYPVSSQSNCHSVGCCHVSGEINLPSASASLRGKQGRMWKSQTIPQNLAGVSLPQQWAYREH